MKKIYSKPSIKVMEVEAEQLLAASISGGDQTNPGTSTNTAKGINMWLLDDNEVESTSSNIFDDENW